jgi:hypothetical protein
MGLPAEDLSETFGLAMPNRITEGITHRQMSILLKEAAAEAEARMQFEMARNSFSSGIRAQQLAVVNKALGEVSTELWSGTGRITVAGSYQQAQLAADQAIDLDFFLGMPSTAITQYAQQIYFDAKTSVEAIISRRTNGYTLAERIYANGKVSTAQAGRIVEKGLAQQLSAKEISRQVKGFYSPDVPGGASYAANRLARTEINNAHHHTTMRLSQNRPWIKGFKWNLSRSHPKPDPCDALATHDEGLGVGVFSKNNPPDRPHPQCLCYVTHLQEDDDVFQDKLVSGEYDPWLSSKGVRC